MAHAGAKQISSDATKPVDANLDGHEKTLLKKLPATGPNDDQYNPFSLQVKGNR